MLSIQTRNLKGFTLLEMMLVLVIASSMLFLFMNYSTQKTDELRRDRVSLQVQQILNAGLSYYVNNGQWPKCTASTSPPCNFNTKSSNLLQTDSVGYFPQITVKNPWGQPYFYMVSGSGNMNSPNFYVYTNVATVAIAQQLVGRLPVAFITDSAGATAGSGPVQSATCATTTPGAGCTYIVSAVNIPGQNLNNALSANYVGVFSNGDCVPVPTCPTNMTAQIFVAVASVAGQYYQNNPNIFYPINGFAAYATGNKPLDKSPPPCNYPTESSGAPGVPNCAQVSSFPSTAYWRACLDVSTEIGQINNSTSGQFQNIIAITRCTPNAGEPSGGSAAFTVWQQ